MYRPKEHFKRKDLRGFKKKAQLKAQADAKAKVKAKSKSTKEHEHTEDKHELSEKQKMKMKQGEAYMKLARLGEWLVANGAWMAGHKIALKVGIHGSGFGYGVTARQPLSVGRSLCIIPKSLVISVKTCGVRKEIEEAMIIGEVGTALALLYEKSSGEESHWFPYLNLLPEFEPLPYFWSEEEQAHLKGTDVEKIVAKYKGLLKEDYESLVLPLIHAHPKKFPAKVFSFKNFFKACSLVSSRAFMVDSYHGDSMVPLADLYVDMREEFNHKTAQESVHFESVDTCPVCGKSEGCDHEAEEISEEEDEEESEDGDVGSHEDGEDESKEGESEEESEDRDEAGQSEEDGASQSEEEEEEDEDEEEQEEEEDVEEAEILEEEEGEKKTDGGEDDGTANGKRKATDDEIEMVVVRPVLPNGEVYNTFGELSNSCLLTKYGFTETENKFDTVDLKASLIVSTISSETMKVRFSQCTNLLKQKVFEIGFDGAVEPNLIRVLHVCDMAEAAYKNWEEEPKKAKLRHLDAMVVDAIMRGTEGVRISEVILAAVEERNKRYTTTRKKDLKDLKAALVSSPARYALILRTSERQIIQRAMELYSTKGEKAREEQKEIVVVKAGPIIKASKLRSSKVLKQKRLSKYTKKKTLLREKRQNRVELARARAVLALDQVTTEHQQLMQRRGQWVPFPKLFPLDLRTDAQKRPLQIDYNFRPKKIRKSDYMRKKRK